MAHFAKMENDIVQEVIVIKNDVIDGGSYPASEILGQEFIASIPLDGHFLQCSYSGSFRGCYPGAGYSYDPALDIFVQPAATEVTP